MWKFISRVEQPLMKKQKLKMSAYKRRGSMKIMSETAIFSNPG